MGFLLSRRWVLLAAVIAVVAWGCVQLGEWQFHRLDQREARNAATTRNLAEAPVAMTEVLSLDSPVPQDHEWRRVQVQGTYDDEATVVVRYQTRDGASGVDLVTPLVTEDGAAVLVDRGWMATENSGAVTVDLPAPPAGVVEVVGWVRADGTGAATKVTDRSVRAVSSRAVGADLDYPLYQGFLDAQSEAPPPATELLPAELPDLGEGPHFFYGLQWWFFGGLAVFGFGYLAFDERRKRAEPTGPEQHEAGAATGD